MKDERPACVDRAVLAAWLVDGGDNADAIEAHVETCADCQGVLAELTETSGSPIPSATATSDQTSDPGVPSFLADLALSPPGSLGFATRLGPTPRSVPVDPNQTATQAGPAMPSPDRARPPRIEGFLIREMLGRGGMGVVYKAEQLHPHRIVALKVSRHDAHSHPLGRERFLAEIEAVARLLHPNIVRVYTAGEHDGCPYFAMEFVTGGSLDRLLDGRPQTPSASAAFLKPIAEAIGHAHRHGILHRDLKPGNILLDGEGTVSLENLVPKIADFGLAKLMESGAHLTRTGDLVGTPNYMAPEQAGAGGGACGPATDLHALGAILYELLTGRPPFVAPTMLETLEQVRSSEPVPPSRIVPGIPRDLQTICLKCLEKEPARRYASADALAADLGRFLRGEPIAARPVRSWERAWKFARRRPVLTGFFVAVQALLLSLLIVVFRSNASISAALEDAEREERKALQASRAAMLARNEALAARDRALAETYRAALSEARTLRAGRPPGWRENALRNLGRLAVLPTPRRDLPELRTEAVACLGTIDIRKTALIPRGDGLTGSFQGLCFTPDGRSLVTVGSAGSLHVWDVNRHRHVSTYFDSSAPAKVSDFGVHGFRFLAGGGLAYMVADRGVARLDASMRRTGSTIERNPHRAVCLSASGNGRWLAIGWSDGVVTLHSAEDGSVRGPFRADPARLALSRDGLWLATRGPDNIVEVRRTDRNDAPLTLGRHRTQVRGLAFGPDGMTVAGISGGDDPATILWDFPQGGQRLNLRGHREVLNELDFSPDGRWLATSSVDTTTRVWDVRTGREIAVLPGDANAAAVAFSPDGDHLAACTASATTLYRIEGQRESRRLIGHQYITRCVVADPRRPRFVTGSDDCTAIVWEPVEGRALHQWKEGELTSLTAVAFNPAGTLMACAHGFDTANTGIRLRDAESGALRAVLTGLQRGCFSVAFDETGQQLAAADDLGQVAVWDVASGRLTRLASVKSRVRSLAFLDDGRRIVVGIEGLPTVVLDLTKTEPVPSVIHPDVDGQVVVDRPRNRLILGTNRGTLSELALPDLKPVRTLDRAHDGAIESLAFSPDGRWLATGGRDRRVVLRDAVTLEPLLSFPEWTGTVKSIAFDVEGRWLAFVGSDPDVALWDLGLVREGLTRIGLAWDRAAPEVGTPTDFPVADALDREPPIPIIRVETTDPAEIERAWGIGRDGFQAYRAGRPGDAIALLERSRDALRPLHLRHPGDDRLAARLGQVFGFLGCSLRDTGRSAEALAAFREAGSLMERLAVPSPIDLYNLACDQAQVAALSGTASPSHETSERENLLARAVVNLKHAVGMGLDDLVPLDNDRDLDPLRDRADFRALMKQVVLLRQDRAFPANPFLGPMPAPPPLADAPASQGRDAAHWAARGYELGRQGHWQDALDAYREALDLDPSVDSYWLYAAPLYLQVGDEAGYRRHARAMLDRFEGSESPMTAERTAKVGLLAPPAPNDQDLLVALADRAVTKGAKDALFAWFALARGMAAYRAGRFDEAVRWLRASQSSGIDGNGLTANLLYQAMSEHRLGSAESARRLLDEARKRHALASKPDDYGTVWPDWLIAELARREAESLLPIAPPKN